MTRLEFFFDCGSPWTYLAFHKIEELAEEAGAELIWRPILVGGVFNSVNPEVYEARANPNPRRARYHAKDLADWARLYGLQMSWPDVFPVNSVKAMRGALVAGDADRLPPYARATFERYWGKGEDISQEGVLASIAEGVGLDPGDFLEAIRKPSIKDRLRANTDELIERGGFGSPTMFVDGDDMFFGNDRLPLVRAALDRHV
ncbi:MAG: 2-hydroxychromene-2-carboxylate isomerase [bacterium]|nr:2-hydroxychromene-2-carboxylate isomerase [bacterium]MCP5069666.1 2-hydroxychromene-2-carboxylate isomerase [bacterium]